MSRECIITTDGPHFIWAPGAARESPPNLKIWVLDQYEVTVPKARINAQHLLISQKYILTGDQLKVGKIFKTDQLFESANPEQPEEITNHISRCQKMLEKLNLGELEYDYRIRSNFFVTFGYKQEVGKPRKILRAAVVNLQEVDNLAFFWTGCKGL